MPPDPSRRPHPTSISRSGPIDPDDADRHDRNQRAEISGHPWALLVIGVGGMLGASARYGLELLWPHRPTGVPWSTFTANVTGCLVLGVVMVVITESGQRHPLWRPFLGVGVLGGFTTFSTYAVQVQQAIQNEEALLALCYLFGTLVAALVAVAAGTFTARSLLTADGRHHPPAPSTPPRALRDSGDAGAGDDA